MNGRPTAQQAALVSVGAATAAAVLLLLLPTLQPEWRCGRSAATPLVLSHQHPLTDRLDETETSPLDQEPAPAPWLVPGAAAGTAAADAAAASPAAAADEPDADCAAAGGSVCRSVARAKRLLGGRIAGTSDRLVAPMLTGKPGRVCCAVENMQQQVFNTTPVDLFVFSANNSAEAVLWKKCPDMAAKENVFFMPHDEHWVTPPEAGDPELWRTKKAEGYRRMGHWRLLFQFEFADRLGYRYVWQTDDDSRMLQPVGFNMREYLQQRGLLMAAARRSRDPVKVTDGLPELTAYFLRNEMPRLKPQTLFDDCNPPALEGLITQPISGNTSGKRGWRRTILYGNCVMIDVQFWFRPDVQRYVKLVLSTGGHFRLRWQEQAVQAMVWRIFVPRANFTLLPIKHKHPSMAC